MASTVIPDFIQILTQTLGADAVLHGKAIPTSCASDWSGTLGATPLALARPRDTTQVCALLRLCHQHRVAVVPQGGLTGLAGAAVTSADCVAVSLARMNAIEHIDPQAALIQVQAGCTVQTVQDAASAAGMRFGVDFGARGTSQIGGAIATNAGGNGVLQHGMMRDQVLGLEVVLADGTVLSMLRPMLKNNTGYDLKQFFIGAEGTLGVITRALLRLRHAPRARATVLLALTDFDAALAALDLLHTRFGNRVAAFELMWAGFVEASLAWQKLTAPFTAPHPMLALADVDGSGSTTALHDELQDVLAEAMTVGTVTDAILAQSEAQAKQLWQLREAPAELPVNMHPPVNFDVSLARADIGRFASACNAMLTARWPGHHTLFFGHIGDGNLHISVDGASVGGGANIHALEAAIYQLVGDYSGSVSAEHGIGLHKKPWLAMSRSPAEIAAMRAIKRVFDQQA